jgi:hypothetical protein
MTNWFHEIKRDGFHIVTLQDVGAPAGMFPPTGRDYEACARDALF